MMKCLYTPNNVVLFLITTTTIDNHQNSDLSSTRLFIYITSFKSTKHLALYLFTGFISNEEEIKAQRG